ncbi:MAG: hypothetical protein J6C22_18160 [Bacteroides sp.]|nr:hypothetical protein [Bacteroides sp.]
MKLDHSVPEKIRKFSVFMFVCSIISGVLFFIASTYADYEMSLVLLYLSIFVVVSGYLTKLLLTGFAILVDNSMNAEDRASGTDEA